MKTKIVRRFVCGTCLLIWICCVCGCLVVVVVVGNRQWWRRVSDDNGLAGFCLWLLGGFESVVLGLNRPAALSFSGCWVGFFKFQWLLLGVCLSFGCWGFVRGGGGWFCSRRFGCCSTLILGWVLELNQRLNTFTTAALQVADLTAVDLTCRQLATGLAPHRSEFLGWFHGFMVWFFGWFWIVGCGWRCDGVDGEF